MTDVPVSVRNLQDGFYELLRRFTATFDGYEPEPAKGYEGTRINLNFKDMEVTESIEPFNLPTYTINIGQSNKKESRWGYFGSSLAKFLNETDDIDDAIGKRIGLVYCDGKDGRPDPRPIWNRDADKEKYPDGRVPNEVWEVYELEGSGGGASSASADDQAKKLLDGKTLSEFNKEALADPVIRKNTELQRSIMDKSWVKAMVVAGEFTKDENDLYHRTSTK